MNKLEKRQMKVRMQQQARNKFANNDHGLNGMYSYKSDVEVRDLIKNMTRKGGGLK